MKKIAIIGSTGSIGTQTLEVVRANNDIQVIALAAGNNTELLEKQAREFKPSYVCIASEEKAKDLFQSKVYGKTLPRTSRNKNRFDCTDDSVGASWKY